MRKSPRSRDAALPSGPGWGAQGIWGHPGRLVCLHRVRPSQQLLYLAFNCDLPQAAATLGKVRPKDAWLCGTHTHKGHQGPLS